MNFTKQPLIQRTVLGREAKVSDTRTRAVIEQLKTSGAIHTTRTPTGREFLTVPHAEIVFNALVGKPQLRERRIAL